MRKFRELHLHCYLGYTSTEPAFGASSILSMSDPSTQRTHIVFQRAQLQLQQYDFEGFGANQALVGNTTHAEITPGTRLSGWVNNGLYIGTFSVYYQMSNTSDLYYSTFHDANLHNNNSVYTSPYDPEDALMPLVRTYGKDAGKGKVKMRIRKIVKIVFTVIGVIIGLLIICCCCGLCA